MTPKQLFLTKGIGQHRNKVVSFELALREAGIAQYNLVEVSSIFPPGCEIIKPEAGINFLSPGEIVYCVMSRNSTDEAHQMIAASVGLAVPEDRDKYGYLLEYQSFNQSAEETGKCAESLAAEMLATTLADSTDSIAKTTNITKVGASEGNDLWTTVVAVAVFIPGEN